MKFIAVEGHQGIARDARTGAIVNINSNEIEQARAVKALRRRKDDETEIIKEEVASLKNDMSEIKQLLHQLVEKR
jgi:hypothetical protein|tara:strand:- start:17 stop:241 length:225 start_codon:yes stop_codon:yes gene_type:complete